MTDTNCPRGTECPFHFRVDQTELDDTTMELVTYVGDYAVMTEVAPELVTSGAQTALSLGLIDPENMYVTFVAFLGNDQNSLASSTKDVDSKNFYRYWVRHNDVDNLKEAHNMVVDGLKTEMLDVSSPRGDEYFDEAQALADVYQRDAMNNYLDNTGF